MVKRVIDEGLLDQFNDVSTFRGGKKLTKETNETLLEEGADIDEALVSKQTLERYRAKSKQKFREKGGINAALEKQDKEDKAKKVEVRKEDVEIDEAKYPGYRTMTKAQRTNARQDQIFDKARQLKAEKQKSLSKSLDRGLKMRMKGDGGHVPNFKESIVDLVMVSDELGADPYISEIEARMNDRVAEIKDAMKHDLFNFGEMDEGWIQKDHADATSAMLAMDKKAKSKPKPGSPGGSWVDRDVADKYKKQAKEKKQFASAKREIDQLKKKGK